MEGFRWGIRGEELGGLQGISIIGRYKIDRCITNGIGNNSKILHVQPIDMN